MKKQLTIVTLFAYALSAWAGSGSTLTVDCGSWVELTATPYEDYHFVSWSDGNTDSLRRVQVDADASYIAYFAANCEEYANWPVDTYYDWLVMLNVRKVNAMGYYVSPQQVMWYRVVGDPDDMHDAFPQDDQFVCTGYYLTIDRNLWGTGDYYCVADASDSKGLLCDGLMRSEIVHYATAQQKARLTLTPNSVSCREQMMLRGLIPGEYSRITIYNASGNLLEQIDYDKSDQCALIAPSVTGCYLVRVESATYSETLRFIVSH